MMKREALEKPAAARGKTQDNGAMIHLALLAAHKPVSLQPVAQLNSSVMLNLQHLGNSPHCRIEPSRCAAYGQKSLVLLRFEPRIARRLFAEIQKLANLVPEFRQGLIAAVHFVHPLSLTILFRGPSIQLGDGHPRPLPVFGSPAGEEAKQIASSPFLLTIIISYYDISSQHVALR